MFSNEVYRMHFYALKTKDSLIHVQNIVMGMYGQHHIHTKEDFEQWKKQINPKSLHIIRKIGVCETCQGKTK